MDFVVGLIFYLTFLLVGLYLWIKQGVKTKEELSYDKIRSLIRQEVKPTVVSSQGINSVDKKEAYFYNLQSQYKIALMFGKTSLTPKNQIKLSNGDTIAPYSREHGLKSLESAIKLREQIIETYHIDLEDLSDKSDYHPKLWN